MSDQPNSRNTRARSRRERWTTIQRGGSVPAFVLLLVAVAVFGLFVWYNARPVPDYVPIFPTAAPTTADTNAWQGILRQGFGSNSTPLPTVAIPTAQFEPPTLPPSMQIDMSPLAPGEVDGGATQASFSLAVTPTLPPPTPAAVATSIPITVEAVTRPPSAWQPPPLVPPISRDPYGRDHYWFSRPVDSNGMNYALASYTFGSDGPVDNPLRVHHGIDMPNPIGETVRAAGSGTIIWAADGLRTEGAVFENSPSYGNVVVIQHDFGYQGKTLYSIYAHLSAALVLRDQHVNAGDAIGLVGNSGNVTGPHVHFEVRLGENRYGATYNPVLWMVPYVGHGVIAGRVTDAKGNVIPDANITIRNWATGLITETATTYVIQNTSYDVQFDPVWQENFAVGDIPTGRYEVITAIEGLRVSRIIDVLEGTTSFVDLTSGGATPGSAASTP